MVYSPDKSQTLIGACTQFIKSYPDDKRTEEAQQKIDETARHLLRIPGVIRENGIPFANGFGVNLSGVAISGGMVDLKAGGSGFIAPYRPGERDNLNKANPVRPFNPPRDPSDASTIEERSRSVTEIKAGMTLSQITPLLGNCTDSFELAGRLGYQMFRFYDLKDGKTAILWFDKSDALTFLYITALAK